MQVKSIAECSKGSILQYFRPSLSYHLSLTSLFCLFLSGSLRQVLLYTVLFFLSVDPVPMHGLHKCPINSDWQFACSRSSSIPNLICIHKSWVCDQDNDCPDGEDEENCGELTFLKIEFLK